MQIAKSQIKFEVGNYDRSKTLTIDPSVNLKRLATSTFLGGEAFDGAEAIDTDKAGNIYVAGRTQSTSFSDNGRNF